MRFLRVPVALCAVLALLPVPAARAGGPCASATRPRLAASLGRQVAAALRGRAGTESVAVLDREHGIVCSVRGDRRYDSASVVKVTILGALLYQRRGLTSREKALARRMITRSDNDAASALWRQIGRTRMNRFLVRAGMRHTRLGPTHFWGLTQITANDELRLLRVLTSHGTVLSDKARRYILDLMHQVIPQQRWGVPAGRPPGVVWHVKNGWLPRHDRYWRVHSIGSFSGRHRDYLIVVLTQDTPSMRYGVATIERVARAVHGTLNPADRSALPPEPQVREESDGSVPPWA
ncbi:hypothetical protein BTM25_08190 [Actinomadura rubteroloni]|uniref:Beta-lactamase class A catalytic domain-containing protein n=1 Tax=Actinomadura rubteroloni TaxID=1926885 RepID=A0A2P4UN32_9ACTN|nr:serine hydrolase [Actinomadura rubteroloni]POM26419.1 hypothetical protein BTM25_08190 [Actinomadura rubteroloni]